MVGEQLNRAGKPKDDTQATRDLGKMGLEALAISMSLAARPICVAAGG